MTLDVMKNSPFVSQAMRQFGRRISQLIRCYLGLFSTHSFNCHLGRTSSVGRVLYCRAGGRRFDSQGRANTQSIKITEDEGTAFALQTVGPLRGSDDHVETAVPSPLGDVKIVSPISTFVLNTLTLKKKCGWQHKRQ